MPRLLRRAWTRRRSICASFVTRRASPRIAARLAEVEALEAKLSQTKTEPEFVRDIEALAAKTGVAIAQFDMAQQWGKSRGLKSADFEFFLNGSYANLRRFIVELPTLNEFVAIERISLERNGPAVRAFLVLQRHYKAE